MTLGSPTMSVRAARSASGAGVHDGTVAVGLGLAAMTELGVVA